MRTVRQSVAGIFLIPASIALLTFMGLIVGLLGDGMRDALAWVGLAVPLIAISLAMVRRTEGGT